MVANRKKNINFLLLFFSIFFFISCGGDIEFTEYKTLQNSTWKAYEKVNINFTIEDTISPKNLFLNIRNNQDYGYSNLFIITNLKFPNGTEVIDTLQYEMTNKNGEFLGNGISSIKENKLFYKESKVFPEKGNYEFSVYHAMRKQGEVIPIENLVGIQDVGISIEKIRD